MQRLDRTDWTLIAVCAAIAAVSLFVVFNWFSAAFPQASIEFRVDRGASARVAESLLAAQRVDTRGLKHTAVFDSDETARIFLERSLGLPKAKEVMRGEVRLWRWSHRWFRPLQEEEWGVDVAPTGEIIGYSDNLPEDRALPSVDLPAARSKAEEFLRRVGVDARSLRFVSQSERRLPHRVQRIFTWESLSVHPAGAPYRFVVNVDGDRVSRYEQRLKVPDEWLRGYRELRSKNFLAGNIDLVFLIITMIAAVVVFIVRLLRGDLALRLLFGVGAVTFVLAAGSAVNSLPSALARYNTTTSYPAFIARTIFFDVVLQGIGAAILLMVVAGAGEVLYRERLPGQLALPRLWTPRALASKRVFRSFLVGYTLVAFFFGYQVAFYLIADKFGAWSPADVPYDEMLSSAIPWVAVLFAGFFPAMSEEFLSRAFSLPFFERVLHSRIAAIVVAGFIWGFGHATYPNQPFFIRGLEVGLAGILLGFLFYRFGIVPLLIWHFTVDALYTALLLLRSGNRYYVISGALASLVFAIPMLASIVLYLRNGGFVPDDDLSNATIPVKPAPAAEPRPERAFVVPEPVRISPLRLVAAIVLIAIAVGCVVANIPSIDDAIDYTTTADDAKRAARAVIPSVSERPVGAGGAPPVPTRPLADARGDGWTVLAQPVEGFRSWDRDAPREDGGAPGGFDAVAADYLLRHGLPMRELVYVLRTKVYGATWMVRAFRPLQKEEYFVEVHAREARVVGYHRYQNEKRPGAQLDQAQALAIARGAFGRFGVIAQKTGAAGFSPPSTGPFDLKEALAFQQPARRDWLFHFDERQPIAGEGVRRVTVRVAGNEISQFAATIKIPESAYREASKQTVLNVVVLVLRLLASLGILGLIIAGFILVMRRHAFPWRNPLRWTLALAVVAAASAFVHWPQQLFNYNTSVGWQTFVSGALIDVIRNLGLQLGLVFLAVAAIEATVPNAFALHRREVRARTGRAALLAALAAIAVVVLRHALLQLIALRWPQIANAGSLNVPEEVALPLPALLAVGKSVMQSMIGCAAIALFVAALQGFRVKPWLPSLIGAVLLFLATLDPSAGSAELPFSLLSAATAALAGWLIVRHLLGENLLAYPLAIALALLLGDAAALLQNHRADLRVNAFVEIAVAVVVSLWVAFPRQESVA
jgi:membrane protease YdiL (CAAX protease family)